MSRERKPEDMICPLYKMAAIIIDSKSLQGITCDGEECALWSKGSGLKRCGLRQI